MLKRIIEENNICDKSGQLAHVTTHDFRRTYATIADRMGKSPDKIQHGLRHLNLDMQDSYVSVPPQEQEKRIQRTLVNKNGEITTYKTDKDAETIRVEWKLRQVETGLCTRPSIMEECEYEYVYLGFKYVRFSEEHLPKLLAFRQNNLEILNRCIENGQAGSRRANSVRHLLDILSKIIASLENEIESPCPHCQSEKVVKHGYYFYKTGETKQHYLCKACRKTFFTEYFLPPPEPADMDCPKCNSSNTFKSGQPLQRTYGEVQKCRCTDCGHYFLKGLGKRLYLYNKGELRVSFWEHNIPEYCSDVACPNCHQYQALLTCEHKDKYLSRMVKRMLCLNCGQKFTGEGRPWTTQKKRTKGKKIEKRPFKLEDDQWDLRELYPQVDEYSFKQLFLNFGNAGDANFKKLVKDYLLERIRQGLKYSTIEGELSIFRIFGNFLKAHKITSLEEINREILAIYWNQERSQISAKTQQAEVKVLRHFFSWLNQEKNSLFLKHLSPLLIFLSRIKMTQIL